MKRQAMTITISQLAKLKLNLIKQHFELNKQLKIKNKDNPIENQKFLVGIINKKGMSDTWELE